MKKRTLLLIAMFIGMLSFAQGGFNYKALITQNGTPLANATVKLKFSIQSQSSIVPDDLLWQEEHTNVPTDANGICSVVIGKGTRLAGTYTSFYDIDWHVLLSTVKLKVEVDTGNGYQTLVPYTAMESVPYAKQAVKAVKLDKQYGELAFADSGSIKFDANNTGSNRFELKINGMNGLSVWYNGDPKVSFMGNVTFFKDIQVEDIEMVQGKKIKAFDSGDADMKAYIYGSSSSGGSIITPSSSDGFTVQKTGTGAYKISFDVAPGSYNKYIVIASIRFGDVGFISVDKYAGYFNIKTYDTSGNAADYPFDFVVYKK